MTYLINLIDVDGTQLVFSSEMASTVAEALEHIHRFQHKAVIEGWHQARITVGYGEIEQSYSPREPVTPDRFIQDLEAL